MKLESLYSRKIGVEKLVTKSKKYAYKNEKEFTSQFFCLLVNNALIRLQLAREYESHARGLSNYASACGNTALLIGIGAFIKLTACQMSHYF